MIGPYFRSRSRIKSLLKRNDGFHFWNLILQSCFDSLFKGQRRHGAVAACALEADRYDAFIEVDVFNIATVSLQSRTDSLEDFFDSFFHDRPFAERDAPPDRAENIKYSDRMIPYR